MQDKDDFPNTATLEGTCIGVSYLYFLLTGACRGSCYSRSSKSSSSPLNSGFLQVMWLLILIDGDHCDFHWRLSSQLCKENNFWRWCGRYFEDDLGFILPRIWIIISLGPNVRLWQWRFCPQLTAMLTSTSTPTKQFLFRWGQNKQSCNRFFYGRH